MSAPPDPVAVKTYLLDLQDRICAALEQEDGGARFAEDAWQRTEGEAVAPHPNRGHCLRGRPRRLFPRVRHPPSPPSATAHRPELAGKAWQALGVSLVLHPRNPHVPTSHANVRFFVAEADDAQPVWWFGGGFDLTPYYASTRMSSTGTARPAMPLAPFGDGCYPRMKRACDEYFFLKHRGEPRGVGGLFFDDYHEGGFERSFALMRSVGDHFIPAYLPIVARRKATPYSAQEREFQLYRRGRYVEFNLVWDRGTLFGLQSGGRTESILMSLPPLVTFKYDWRPEPGSPEARLYEHFLRPRDWLAPA